MAEPKNLSSNIFYGGGHFEFSSEKNWGVEHKDCKIFHSIDITHLADSIGSVPFNLRHDLPSELFAAEQLDEFAVESFLASSQHKFQCNSKLKYKSVEYSKEAETDKLMKLILNDVCGSEKIEVSSDEKVQTKGDLDFILGNMKPLINVLKEETTLNSILNTNQVADPLNVENHLFHGIDSAEETTKHDNHWLDSMLDSD